MSDQLQPTNLGPMILTAPDATPGIAVGEPHFEARFAEIERLFESFLNRVGFPEPGCGHGPLPPLGGGAVAPGYTPGTDIDPGMSPHPQGYIIPGHVSVDDPTHAF